MKQRLFTVAAGAIALLAGVMWVIQGASRQEAAPSPGKPDPLHAAAIDPTPEVGLPSPTASPQEDNLYGYAIATTELRGLAPDATPGTRLDLWVALHPPVIEREDVLPVLEGAILQELVPPILPDAPSTAILQVPLRQARRLMWAHRFGSLSVLNAPPSQP